MKQSGSFELFATCWQRSFQAFGSTPHQSLGHIHAESCRTGIAKPTLIETEGAISAFRVTNWTAQCLVEGAGVLQTGDGSFNARKFLIFAQRQLNVGYVQDTCKKLS